MKKLLIIDYTMVFPVGQWKCGRWTAQELKTLKQNVKEFLDVSEQVLFGSEVHWLLYRTKK